MFDCQLQISRAPLCETSRKIGNAEVRICTPAIRFVSRTGRIKRRVPLGAKQMNATQQRKQDGGSGLTPDSAKNHGFGLGQLGTAEHPG
jgi:hypothetical protein